jgi:predicted transcriptional regulator
MEEKEIHDIREQHGRRRNDPVIISNACNIGFVDIRKEPYIETGFHHLYYGFNPEELFYKIHGALYRFTQNIKVDHSC